jgi:NADPH2:quinone reductase
MMRAWQVPRLGEPWDVLTVVEVDPPEPAAGTVRVEVEAAEVNFADILQCRGHYQVKLEPPFVPGLGAVGRVVSVGDGVDLSLGDRVVGSTTGGWGGFAAEALITADDAHLLPDSVTGPAAAAAHVAYGTAWFALHHRGRLRDGESVLVLAAAGGVGSAAVRMATASGCRVLAAAGGPDKAEICRRLGADVVIDYRTDDLYETVMDATDGRGVDLVFDPVGGDHFDTARRLVAWEGRLLVVGFASGTIPSAPANHVMVKNYSVVGVHMGGYRTRQPGIISRCYNEVYRALAAGELAPLETEVLAFDTLPEGLHRLSLRRTTGRLVLEPR